MKKPNKPNKPNKDFKWLILNWDVNQDRLEHYDVVPLLTSVLEKLKKKERPQTTEACDDWLTREVHYYFWSKAECEILVSGLFSKNNSKIDICHQLLLNWTAFVRAFWENVASRLV